MTTPFLAFLAGLLTILSPCVLPLAPIVIAGAQAKDVRSPLALVAGLAVTFGIVGGTLAAFGIEIGSSEQLRTVVAVLMLAVGLFLAVPQAAHAFERVTAPVTAIAGGWQDAHAARSGNSGLLGDFGMGAILALAWAPCAGPTLGAALVLAAKEGSVARAAVTMTFYALGTAVALLAAGYLLRRLTSGGRRWLNQGAAAGRIAFGIAFIVIGALILTGLDHRLEGIAVEHMPDWLVTFATRL